MDAYDEPLPGGARPVQNDHRRPPDDWPAWTGIMALLAALVLAAVSAAIVDIPAVVLGVKITSSHVPAGIELGDTFVQDIVFVLTAILFASLGGRTVHSWQFGLRPARWWRSIGLAALTIAAFLIFSEVWAELLEVSTKEKLLEQLGANETALLLALSALLTTVVAPIAEETLFRGYIFRALAKWRGWLPGALLTGLLFGAVHASSAPAVDLLPLAVLGFGLCWLYEKTSSLYPCIATHSLNNSLAFGVLEGWSWQIPLLAAAALGVIWLLARCLRYLGVISPPWQEPSMGEPSIGVPRIGL